MLHFRVYYISKRETKRDFYVPFFCAGARVQPALHAAGRSGSCPVEKRRKERHGKSSSGSQLGRRR